MVLEKCDEIGRRARGRASSLTPGVSDGEHSTLAMSALTSLLVRDGVVPVRKIEEALQRQVISGGDMETLLLEMNAVPENTLAAYKAALLGAEAATREQVMSVPLEILGLVPADVAVQLRLVPLAVEGSTLHVAVADALTPEQEERVGFLLGYELSPRVVCDVRLAAALSLHYEADLAPRMVRLVDKVRSRASGELPAIGRKVSDQLAGHEAEIPQKRGEPTFQRRTKSFGSMILEPAPPESEPPPEPAPEERGRDQDDGSVTSTLRHEPPSSLKRIRGPMTLAAGERRLKQAADRDQILEVLFGFAQQFFDYTALFVVHDEQADGRAAYGPGAPTAEVQALSFPLDRPSIFSEARRTLAPQVRRLDQSEGDRDIALGLRRPQAPHCFVMPVAIRQRVVVLLYGDRDGETFDIGAAMDLVRFGPRVVEAFEQLILRNKRGYRPAQTEAPSPPRENRNRVELKEAARSVAQTAGTARPATEARKTRARTSWHPGRKSSPGFAPPAATSSHDSWDAVARAPQPAPPIGKKAPTPPPGALVDPGSEREASAPPEPRSRERKPLLIDAAPSTVLGIPRAAPPPPPSAELDLAGTALAGLADDEEPELSFETGDEDEPDVVIDMNDDDDVDYDDDQFEADDEEWGEDPNEPDAAPASSRERSAGTYQVRDAPVDVVRTERSSDRPRPRSVRPPKDPRRDDDDDDPRPEVVRVPDNIRSEPPRGLDAETRSVIVDMGEQVHAQVADLAQAEDRRSWDGLVDGLLALGDAALPVLVQAFPGKLAWTRRKGGKLPAGRDLSPVARALVAFGERAASYTASLLGSAHPDVRFYAILIAAELVHPDLTDAVAERIHDEDEGVRRLAVQLLPRFASFRGFDEVRTVVRRTARLRGKDPSRRLQAIDAVAALHDVEMIPKLIEHLKDHDDDLVEHAHRALVAITGNDVGATHRKWSSWWEKNRARHRIEWLIDGLGHTDEKVRRHAGEELQRATQQYYGYHPGSPKRDRDLVAKRYRQWWDREGQRRFA